MHHACNLMLSLLPCTKKIQWKYFILRFMNDEMEYVGKLSLEQIFIFQWKTRLDDQRETYRR